MTLGAQYRRNGRGSKAESLDQVLAAVKRIVQLGAEPTIAAIAARAGLQKGSATNYLGELVLAGRLKRIGRGKYRLAEAHL